MPARFTEFRKLLMLLAVALIAFAVIAAAVQQGGTENLDTRVLMAARDTTGHLTGPKWLAEAARDITGLGSNVVLALACILAAFYLKIARRYFELALLATSVAAGLVLTNLLKIGVDRVRPDLPETPAVFSASFPSGHATMSALVFLVMAFIVTRIQRHGEVTTLSFVSAVGLIVLVGISRIYLGLHYPSDVLAGWCLGVACVVGAMVAVRTGAGHLLASRK